MLIDLVLLTESSFRSMLQQLQAGTLNAEMLSIARQAIIDQARMVEREMLCPTAAVGNGPLLEPEIVDQASPTRPRPTPPRRKAKVKQDDATRARTEQAKKALYGTLNAVK